MIGIDTNVLIRYLVQDDPKQSKQANHLIEKSLSSGEDIWICQITLCETVWVLEKSYKLPKDEIIYILQELLQSAQIKIENEPIVRNALKDYEFKKTGFVDCLIGRQNLHNGCSITYTLDKAAAKHHSSLYKSLKPLA